MKIAITYLLLLITPTALFAQKKVVGQVDTLNKNVLHLKWYFPQLINADGYTIYRREESTLIWKKLNTAPILYKSIEPNKSDYLKDKELKNYIDLASNPNNMKDIILLATILKSFKSPSLCKYLGIWLDDESNEPEKKYIYKVCALKQGLEIDSALSEFIQAGKYMPVDAPQNIKTKTGNKKVSFTWLPEPERYFAVNIYRCDSGDAAFKCITKDPIILSKIKNKEGKDVYGDEFFVNSKLKVHHNYKYYLEAIDFFGNPSLKSDVIEVNLKDLDPPKSPDSLFSNVDGRKVKINWKKFSKEEDLLGFNVYRTTRNDTDFVKLNDKIISKTHLFYLDSVIQFGSYMYAVSCIDGDLNEQISNPFFVEVYDNEPPLTPKNFRIETDSGKIIMRWDKNTEADLKGYLIYRTINSDKQDTYVKLSPKPIADNYFTDEPSKGTKNKFLYKIVAIDNSLNRSAYSEFISTRLPDVYAPQSPFLISVNKSEKKTVTLQWLANAEPDLAGYKIYRKYETDSNAVFENLVTKLISFKSQLFTDRTLNEDGVYVYKLLALDSSGNTSSNSNEIKYKHKTENKESAIIFSKLKINYNSKKKRAELQWKIQSLEDLKTCIVYKKKSNENVFIPCSSNLEKMSFVDTDLQIGIQYSYQIRVYNTKGDVFKSESKSILTQ